MTVLLGNGSGGFTPAIGSPVGVAWNPTALVAGDFNNDGKTDLAVPGSLFSMENLTILQGDGTGGFNVSASPDEGSNPIAMAIADFNGDGKPDLAIVNNLIASSITLLLGNGSGNLTAVNRNPYAAPANPSALTVGDFDGDGKLDLAVASFDTNSVTVWRGNGTGGFVSAAKSPFPVGSGPSAFAVGDFNGDGRADLAVANFRDNTITVLVGTAPASTACGDSAVLASASMALTQTVNTRPSTTVVAVPATPFPLTPGMHPQSLVAGDFNGDGKADLAIANSLTGNVTIALGNGAGGFTIAGLLPAGTFPISITVADFNGDGNADLAVANSGSNSVSVFLGNGSGGFTTAPGSPLAVGTFPGSLAVGDFNGDGIADLVIVNRGDSNLSVFLGSGLGGFTAVVGSPFATGGTQESVGIADFNGDGKADLAVVNLEGNVAVLLGDGTGAFKAAAGSPYLVGKGR